jgi:hypothetical protein
VPEISVKRCTYVSRFDLRSDTGKSKQKKNKNEKKPSQLKRTRVMIIFVNFYDSRMPSGTGGWRRNEMRFGCTTMVRCGRWRIRWKTRSRVHSLTENTTGRAAMTVALVQGYGVGGTGPFTVFCSASGRPRSAAGPRTTVCAVRRTPR